MTHRFSPLLFAAAIASLATAAIAQEAIAPTTGPSDLPIAIESAHVHVVNVEVYVTDRDGKAVTGLTREDFVLKEDDRPVEITNFFAVERGRPAESMPVIEAPESDPNAEFPSLPDRQERLPEDQRLHLILYFDNLFLEPFSRGKVIRETRRFLAEHVLPGDRVMVVTFERSLHVRQPFTEDMALIHAALTDIEDMTGLAVQGNAERDRVMQLVDDADTFSEAEQFADFYAKQVDDDRRRSVRALEDLISPMAGLAGRKALLYVSDGLPMTAGADLFELISVRFAKDGAVGFRANRYDGRNHFRRLIATANGHRVTFYTIDAKGLRSHRSLSAEFRSSAEGGSAIAADLTRELNLHEPLQMMALDTGGLSAFNTNNFSGAFDRVGSDFQTYYSLGFSPGHLGSGRAYELDVDVPGRDGLEVRHRTSYRDKTLDTRLVEGVLAALRFGGGGNPLEAQLRLANARPLDNNYRVPIQVQVPFSNVTFLPHEEHRLGRLKLVVAVTDDEGNEAPPLIETLPLNVPASAMEQVLSQSIHYDAELEMRDGIQHIAIGVRDDLSGTVSIVRRTVRLGR